MSATLRCGRGVRDAGRLVPLAVFLVVAVAWPCPSAQAATKAKSEQAVGELVDEALFGEIYAADHRREEFLARALKQSPDFAPARWHTGHVRLENRWVKIDDVPARVRSDKSYREYLQLRCRSADTAAGHLKLGEWCRARRLQDQARAHFTRVIELDPDNVRARSRLSHQRVGNDWFSRDELEQRDADARQITRDLARWRPKIVQVHHGLLRRSEREQEKARARLLAIDDPAAIPAIEQVLAPASQREGELAVKALGNITDHEASRALARQAVSSTWPEVRFEAARELKHRPMEAFVPMMLAMMYTPIRARNELQGGATGSGTTPIVYTGTLGPRQIDDLQRRWQTGGFTHRQTYSREGWTTKQETIFEARYGVPFARARMDMEAKTAEREQWVKDENARTDDLNGRIAAALNVATGQELSAEPEVWWTWWDDLNETLATEKPVQRRYDREDVRFIPQYATYHSCFAADTPVWTADGPRPIQRVEVGDLVLTQDSETGQLAYKPVVRTTLGPPLALVKVGAGSEAFDCTGGHLFWVSGKGWVRARELQAGDVLHGATATTAVGTVDAGPTQRAHNLVVADFHTYFVGRQRILVHDVTARRPTSSIVPGLRQP